MSCCLPRIGWGFVEVTVAGVSENGSVLASSDSVGLNVRWKKKLGSGYSSVVVAGDNVVTMYCDAEHDYLVCIDAKNGETRWQVETGPMYKGENGSFDGPISTPLIHRGLVYALDPAGLLICG